MSIAIIGTGWGARVQVPAFRSAGLDIVALAGSNQTKTEQIAASLGVPFATGDWRAVLARPEVHVVSVVAPPDLHHEMAVAALEAGKHVLCEKPTARDASQARAMLAAAQAYPRLLAQIDHELRFLPAIIRARQMLADGAIGTVRHVLFRVMNNSRADLNRPWNWWSDAERGGGALGAYGSHQIDLLRYLLGAEVTSVAATTNTFVTERATDDGMRSVTSDDYYSLRLQFANNALASIECSAVVRVSEPLNVTLYGAGGTLRWRGGKLHHAEPDGEFRDITPTHTSPLPEGISGDFPYGTVYMAHALRAYLAGDSTALGVGATFVDGLRNQEVLDAARESSRQGGGYIGV